MRMLDAVYTSGIVLSDWRAITSWLPGCVVVSLFNLRVFVVSISSGLFILYLSFIFLYLSFVFCI